MDIGHKQTDDLLRKLEIAVNDTYKQAYKETKRKLDDYLRKYKTKQKIKLKQLKDGEITKEYYDYWLKGQILIGQRWEEMSRTLAVDEVNANKIARSIAEGYMPDVYALNHDYATFIVEKGSLIDTSYTLYDRQTVERLIRDNPKLLPDYTPHSRVAKRIAEGKDVAWNMQKITSALTQAVSQGESIENMSKRLAGVAEMNRNASIRYARTMTTGAENAGRINAYKRAEGMGIKLRKKWLATLDGRTRHSHRQLDGETQETSEKFSNGCMFPGDPDAPQGEVWNCRCTLITEIIGIKDDIQKFRNNKLNGMSYEEWKDGKK